MYVRTVLFGGCRQTFSHENGVGGLRRVTLPLFDQLDDLLLFSSAERVEYNMKPGLRRTLIHIVMYS
jgi:hypothetical protein